MNASLRQSLTLLTEVGDAAACAVALAASAPRLEAGWARVAAVHTACFALLPPLEGAPCALFFECTFEGDLATLADALWCELWAELARVFRHCEGRPHLDAAEALTEFLRARAQRTTSLDPRPAGERESLHPCRVALRCGAVLRRAARSAWPAKREPAAPIDPEALEARFAAVGWQEAMPGVPLLHVAEVLPRAQAHARLKRALHAIDGAARGDLSFARFLLARRRLVFVAYPTDRAAPFSERLGRELASPLARIWAQTRGAPLAGPLVRRRLRARRIERFVLGSRVPVAVWYNGG